MGDLVSMGTKPPSSAVLQTMLPAPPPLWQDWRVAKCSYAGKCAQSSIPFLFSFHPLQQQSPGGSFIGRAAILPLWVASLRMLFENGTLYLIVINILHVSQCFFDLSVRLSGNINRCLLSLFQCTYQKLWIYQWYFLYRLVKIYYIPASCPIQHILLMCS